MKAEVDALLTSGDKTWLAIILPQIEAINKIHIGLKRSTMYYKYLNCNVINYSYAYNIIKISASHKYKRHTSFTKERGLEASVRNHIKLYTAASERKHAPAPQLS